MASSSGGVKVGPQQLAFPWTEAAVPGCHVRVDVPWPRWFFAHDLAHAELVAVETIGQAKPDGEEAVVDAS